MKKALFFKQTYVNAGGERYFLFLAYCLRELGYGVSLVTNFKPLIARAQLSGITTSWITTGFEATAKKTALLFLIFSPVYFSLSAFVMIWHTAHIRKAKRVVFLSTLNEKIMVTPIARFLGWRVYWIECLNFGEWFTRNPLRHAYRKMAKYTTGVIAASYSVQADIKQIVSTARVSVIYFGLSPEEIFQDSVSRKNLSREITIIAVARLHAEKGIDVLIRACARCAETIPLRLVIVGDGEEMDSLKGLADSFQSLVGRVEFAGYQSDVSLYLLKADIFVLPSRVRESFGITIIEAMAAGCCVVASDIGGIPEIVKPGVTGELFQPGDENSLVTILSELASSSARRIRLTENALIDVVSRFSVDSAMHELRKIL